ncbi:hypothetical protein [Deinococcus sp. NW-56]|uniref:hypothetical protein n=1 Tax=Deinococcus sp. NW-56 TaxID=2080419 RepID=UPI000CF5755A|nr:hypothetical protein [Deinococcus sp. NW-56]
MPELRTLTVGELIDQLARHPDDMPVCVAVPARDYWGTTLAEPVREISTRTVQHSDYHRQFALPRNPDREEEEDVTPAPSLSVLLLE